MSDQQKNPSRAILVGAIVAALVLMALVVPFTIGTDKPQTTVANADDADTRIQPVARFEMQKAAPAAPTVPGKPRDGVTVFNTVCGACHNTGVAGAPKAGDKVAWAPRLALGKETLYKSVLGGKNAMPPRGGAADLTDAEIKAAVDYLTGLAK